MTSSHEQRMVVEQLRREAGMKRIKASQAIDDIKKYVVDHEQDDCLLVGFHNQKSNPFREKSSCALF